MGNIAGCEKRDKEVPTITEAGPDVDLMAQCCQQRRSVLLDNSPSSREASKGNTSIKTRRGFQNSRGVQNPGLARAISTRQPGAVTSPSPRVASSRPAEPESPTTPSTRFLSPKTLEEIAKRKLDEEKAAAAAARARQEAEKKKKQEESPTDGAIKRTPSSQQVIRPATQEFRDAKQQSRDLHDEMKADWDWNDPTKKFEAARKEFDGVDAKRQYVAGLMKYNKHSQELIRASSSTDRNVLIGNASRTRSSFINNGSIPSDEKKADRNLDVVGRMQVTDSLSREELKQAASKFVNEEEAKIGNSGSRLHDEKLMREWFKDQPDLLAEWKKERAEANRVKETRKASGDNPDKGATLNTLIARTASQKSQKA